MLGTGLAGRPYYNMKRPAAVMATAGQQEGSARWEAFAEATARHHYNTKQKERSGRNLNRSVYRGQFPAGCTEAIWPNNIITKNFQKGWKFPKIFLRFAL